MNKRTAILIFSTLLFIPIAFMSCMEVDYFSEYSEKCLISHIELSDSDWSASVASPYMTYESVASAVAGTTGLPDETAEIYRLENDNLVPYGDFEDDLITITDPADAGWTEFGGTNSIDNTTHNLDGNALSFDLLNTEYIEYDLNQLEDGAIVGSNYTYRYTFQGTSGTYYFEIEDTVVTTNQTQYYPFISAAGVGEALEVPEDFNEHKITEFTINDSDSDVFRINLDTDGQVQDGYIDNFRIIKTDQDQYLTMEIPYDDADRIDSLELISGWYRFGLWVKADTDLAPNSFDSNAVTLQIEGLSEDGVTDSSASGSFDADDYSDFSSWTEIYIDSELQVDEPSDATSAVIRLSIYPTDVSGGAITADAGSIFISSPYLYYSEDSEF